MSFKILLLALVGSSAAFAQNPTRAERGAPLVDVRLENGAVTLTGRKQVVTLRTADLALTIKAGPATWTMLPSAEGDLRLKTNGEEFAVRLASAQEVKFLPFDSGA